MKQLFSIIFILTLSLSGFSQKSKAQNHQKNEKKIVFETIKEAPRAEYVYVVDTLRIAKGKPCLLIVNVNKNSAEDDTMNTEEKELIQNFGKNTLKIVNIYKHSYIIFENKQTLDIGAYGNSYQAFAYWGGKIEDDVLLKEGTKYATEFVAEQMGVVKESSYVVNTRKHKKEVALLKTTDNITDKSREIMNIYLNNLTTPIPNDKGEDTPLYEQHLANLKRIETYFIENNSIKILIKNTFFNQNHQPISITNYGSDGLDRGSDSFIYKNGMLVKIITGSKSIVVNYDDNKMIFSENRGEANETKVVWLENNVMLKKSYILMIDDKDLLMNYFFEDKFEGNCITSSSNNNIWSMNCSSKTDTFPFIHKFTSFHDGKVVQVRKSKLVKKGDKLFEKYYSTSVRESEKDNFKLFGVFQFNDQNLLSFYDFTKDDVKSRIEINYTFFPKN